MRTPAWASWIINGWAFKSNCVWPTSGYNGYRIRPAGSLMRVQNDQETGHATHGFTEPLPPRW